VVRSPSGCASSAPADRDHSQGRARREGDDLTGPATRLEVPTLILVGSQDRLTTPALAQHLSELIPGSLLRIHEGAGHMLLLEVPEWVNREVLDFVSSMTTPAEVSSSRAIEGQRKPSLVQRFLGWVRRIAPWLTL